METYVEFMIIRNIIGLTWKPNITHPTDDLCWMSFPFYLQRTPVSENFMSYKEFLIFPPNTEGRGS